MSPEVVLRAKEQLISYCWEGLTLEELSTLSLTGKKVPQQKSSIARRREEGKSVVVNSLAPKRGQLHSPSVKNGKSLIASIIMQEAINLRATYGHLEDSYYWQNYPILEKKLKDDDDSIQSIMFADWLVVDDISHRPGRTERHRAYVQDFLDPFFLERYQNNLPTILVFRFDALNPEIELEKFLGVGLSSIVEDPSTVIINLS